MSLYLDALCTASEDRLVRVPLSELAVARGIPSSKLRMLQRYFRLESAAMCDGDLTGMLRAPLSDLVQQNPDLRHQPGQLIYVRTQTHATLATDDWLSDLCAGAGLAHWDAFAQTQTHCAGGLAALDLAGDLGQPLIVLTGEKCFHAITANQSGAALGEAPVAALFRPDRGAWSVSHTFTRHMPQYHENPHRMAPELRKSWEKGFGDFMQVFLTDALDRFDLAPEQIDLVVPYNLNLPLLETVAGRMGWGEITYTRMLPKVGHLFCADVFFNLTQILPRTPAQRILCFAAGMGATFAAIVLEKSNIAIPDAQKAHSGRETPVPTPA